MIRSNPKLTYAGIAVLAAVVAGWALTRTAPSDQNAMGAGDTAAPGDQLVPVNMPTLSDAQQIGQTVFVAKCAACHGTNAGGVDGAGPP